MVKKMTKINKAILREIFQHKSRSLITLITIILIISGPKLFSFIFGSEWHQAGVFAIWLIIWFGANFVQAPSRTLFFVYEKQKLMLWIDTILAIVRSLVLVYATLYYDVVTTVALYSLVSCIFFVFTLIGWFLYIKRKVRVSKLY